MKSAIKELKKYYGKEFSTLNKARLSVIGRLYEYDNQEAIHNISSRIKEESSIKRKLKKRNLSDWREINDTVGVRAVCMLIQDVYDLKEWIFDNFDVLSIKDYVKNPKSNGYRSCHIIIQEANVKVEIQLRTLAMEFWATLEHKMKYKKKINNEMEITSKLEQCAKQVLLLDDFMQKINEDIMVIGEL